MLMMVDRKPPFFYGLINELNGHVKLQTVSLPEGNPLDFFWNLQCFRV